MISREVFKRLPAESGVITTLRYRTSKNEKVTILFGTFCSSPATEFVIRNRAGRVISKGGSIVRPDMASPYEYALTIGRPPESQKGIKLLRHLLKQESETKS